jgi:predicted dinucleotide-binding enzyme
MAKVAFLGLGVMGFPMAGHLAAKGHDVTVYNRTFAKAEAWTRQHKGKAEDAEGGRGGPGDRVLLRGQRRRPALGGAG